MMPLISKGTHVGISKSALHFTTNQKKKKNIFCLFWPEFCFRIAVLQVTFLGYWTGLVLVVRWRCWFWIFNNDKHFQSCLSFCCIIIAYIFVQKFRPQFRRKWFEVPFGKRSRCEVVRPIFFFFFLALASFESCIASLHIRRVASFSKEAKYEWQCLNERHLGTLAKFSHHLYTW